MGSGGEPDPEAYLRALGKRVRILRLTRELTQEELAAAAGVGGLSATVIASSRAASARSIRVGSSVCSSSSGSPAVTRSPGLARMITPAAGDTGASLRARPAPRRQATTPTPYASSRVSTPVAGAGTRWTTCA